MTSKKTHSVTLTPAELIDGFVNIDDVAYSIIEYASDWEFPDSTDGDSISYTGFAYNASGHPVLSFEFEEQAEDQPENENRESDE